MSTEAEQALATREATKAESEAECGDEPKADALTITEAEVLDLLGPSRRDRTQKLVLAFRKRIHDAEREVAEMQEREVALQTQNQAHVSHQAKLKQEREELFALLDKDAPQWRTMREENAALKVRVEELQKRTDAAEQVSDAAAEYVKVMEQHMSDLKRLHAHATPLVETLPAPRRSWWDGLWWRA